MYVMIIITFLSGLMMLSLMRSDIGIRHTLDRYLSGVASDLAENGIEFEKTMSGKGAAVSSANRKGYGLFAGYRGSSESSTTPLATVDNASFEIMSKGILEDSKGKIKCLIQIKARFQRSPDGLHLIDWNEQRIE